MEQPLKKYLPRDMREILALINSTHAWNATVHVFPHRIEVFDGDQPLFYAQTMAEAEAFLTGCFLGTFPGKDLQTIRNEIALGKYEELSSDEVLTMIERDHIDYARRREKSGMGGNLMEDEATREGEAEPIEPATP